MVEIDEKTCLNTSDDKKAKHLDSVHECDELSNSESPIRPESCPAFFGVKSYLHHFYEQMAVKNPQLYEEYEEYKYLIEPKEKRRALCLWRSIFWIGFILLVFGALVLMAGYLMPRMNIDIRYQEEMRIIDRAAYMFNQNLDLCKIIGLSVFCVGGVLLSSSLLLPGLVGLSCLDDSDDDDSTPFKLRIADIDEFGDEIVDENKDKIPATEQLKSVQPRREDNIIITNSGLKQVDMD
ncbi:neurensin-1-like [Oppia nitens]|uniref:neurensin-1-like n=1 Tax=Oppia nitens TaxID=1686743 RepID=UPI0023DBAAA1|nr:neurensin-1-like [Oppia nitens]